MLASGLPFRLHQLEDNQPFALRLYDVRLRHRPTLRQACAGVAVWRDREKFAHMKTSAGLVAIWRAFPGLLFGHVLFIFALGEGD